MVVIEPIVVPVIAAVIILVVVVVVIVVAIILVKVIMVVAKAVVIVVGIICQAVPTVCEFLKEFKYGNHGFKIMLVVMMMMMIRVMMLVKNRVMTIHFYLIQVKLSQFTSLQFSGPRPDPGKSKLLTSGLPLWIDRAAGRIPDILRTKSLFSSHRPGTLKDIAYWVATGLTLWTDSAARVAPDSMERQCCSPQAWHLGKTELLQSPPRRRHTYRQTLSGKGMQTDRKTGGDRQTDRRTGRQAEADRFVQLSGLQHAQGSSYRPCEWQAAVNMTENGNQKRTAKRNFQPWEKTRREKRRSMRNSKIMWKRIRFRPAKKRVTVLV